jgi:3-hydroxybutyryl-CoA dehydrogenase
MKTIAVIGAGTMGTGIAQLCTQSGYNVILYDHNLSAAVSAHKTIKEKMQKWLSKNPQTRTLEDFLSKVTPTNQISLVTEAEYVIEAIPEKISLKQELFKQLEEICKEDTIFATNTSGLSVTEIASVLRKPERLIVTHFFYPPPLMPLVEIARGVHTSDITFSRATKLIESLGKKWMKVKESPLFVVNRILIPMVNEAITVLEEDLCSTEEIDEAIKLCAGHPIGPLALADIIGLDTLFYVAETLFTETNDQKYRPPRLLKQKVRAGELGRKTGKGFYLYNQKEISEFEQRV